MISTYRDKNRILAILVTLLVIYISFTVLRGYIKIYYSVAYAVVAIILTVIFSSSVKKYIFVYWFLFSIIVFVNYLGGNPNYSINTAMGASLSLYTSLVIINIFIDNKYYDNLGKIIVILLGILLILSISTIYHSISDPMLVRKMVKLNELNYISNSIWRKGICSYWTAHSVIYIFPPLVFILKSKTFSFKLRILSGITLTAMYSFLAVSNATTPLIIGTFGVILSLLISHKRKIKSNVIIIIIMITLLGLFVNNNIIYKIFYLLGSIFDPRTSNYSKIQELGNLALYGSSTGSTEFRINLYSVSINSFIQNPIFGSNSYEKISHHSYFIDTLGSLGIVGFFPLILLIVSFIRNISSKLSITKYYYYIGIIMFLIMFTLKNINYYEYWIYVIVFLPGLCLAAENKLAKRSKIL